MNTRSCLKQKRRLFIVHIWEKNVFWLVKKRCSLCLHEEHDVTNWNKIIVDPSATLIFDYLSAVGSKYKRTVRYKSPLRQVYYPSACGVFSCKSKLRLSSPWALLSRWKSHFLWWKLSWGSGFHGEKRMLEMVGFRPFPRHCWEGKTITNCQDMLSKWLSWIPVLILFANGFPFRIKSWCYSLWKETSI